MKKFVTMLLVLVMVLSLAACGGSDGLTVEKGKLHMSTNAEFPPYEMVTNDGGFEGIDVDRKSVV